MEVVAVELVGAVIVVVEVVMTVMVVVLSHTYIN